MNAETVQTSPNDGIHLLVKVNMLLSSFPEAEKEWMKMKGTKQ